jgi:hypothetical protein
MLIFVRSFTKTNDYSRTTKFTAKQKITETLNKSPRIVLKLGSRNIKPEKITGMLRFRIDFMRTRIQLLGECGSGSSFGNECGSIPVSR